MNGSWRLRLVRAAGGTIAADPSLQEPYQASLQGPAPRVRVESGTVALEHRRLTVHRPARAGARVELQPLGLEGRGTHTLKGVGDDWPLFAVSGGGLP